MKIICSKKDALFMRIQDSLVIIGGFRFKASFAFHLCTYKEGYDINITFSQGNERDNQILDTVTQRSPVCLFYCLGLFMVQTPAHLHMLASKLFIFFIRE